MKPVLVTAGLFAIGLRLLIAAFSMKRPVPHTAEPRKAEYQAPTTLTAEQRNAITEAANAAGLDPAKMIKQVEESAASAVHKYPPGAPV